MRSCCIMLHHVVSCCNVLQCLMSEGNMFGYMINAHNDKSEIEIGLYYVTITRADVWKAGREREIRGDNMHACCLY